MTDWKTVKTEDEYSTIFGSTEDAPGLNRNCTPT